MNHEYIHINKACKKYNKSRQTFYNYMNKGWIRNKKVHNKVFLHDEDINKVLSDTINVQVKNEEKIDVIEIAESKIDEEKNNYKSTNNLVILDEAKKWMNDIHTSLSTHIDLSVNDIKVNTDQKISEIQEKIKKENKELKETVRYLKKELETQKKNSWIHEFIYWCILLTSIISILLYIFN